MRCTKSIKQACVCMPLVIQKRRWKNLFVEVGRKACERRCQRRHWGWVPCRRPTLLLPKQRQKLAQKPARRILTSSSCLHVTAGRKQHKNKHVSFLKDHRQRVNRVTSQTSL